MCINTHIYSHIHMYIEWTCTHLSCTRTYRHMYVSLSLCLCLSGSVCFCLCFFLSLPACLSPRERERIAVCTHKATADSSLWEAAFYHQGTTVQPERQRWPMQLLPLPLFPLPLPRFSLPLLFSSSTFYFMVTLISLCSPMPP